MARTYTFAEAVEIIAVGTDAEAIQDLGRRFPIMTQKVAAVAAKGGDCFVDLMSFMPDYVTAGKINSAIKKNMLGEGDEEGEEQPKESKKAKTAKEDEGEENPYSGMNAKQLFQECMKRGLKVEPKKDADYYAAKLMKDDAKPKSKPAKAEKAEKPAKVKKPAKEEDWDDGEDAEDEDEDEKPAKKSKPAAKKAKDGDEEDWEI